MFLSGNKLGKGKIMRYLKKYGAVWCSPCKTLDVSLNKINWEANSIVLEKIDVDSLQKDQLKNLEIRSVPTMILCSEDGTELSRKTGAMTPAQLTEWLNLSP